MALGLVAGLAGWLGAEEIDRRGIASVKRHLAQIGVAIHRLKAERDGKFPDPAIRARDGTPLLSWRVALLPMLGEGELYRQFRLDEPWDGPTNKPLVAKMPAIYAPFGPLDNPPGSTYFQAVVGPGTCYDDRKPAPPDRPADGSTLLIVEAAEAVPWTRPVDLAFDPKGPPPRLGGHFPEGSLGLFADGSVAFISAEIDEATLKALMSRDEPPTLARRTLRDHVTPVQR